MKRLPFYLLVSIVAFFVGIVAASAWILLEITHTDEIVVITEQPLGIEEVELQSNALRYSISPSASFELDEPGFVKFKNISFRYDPKVFSHARVEEILQDSPVEHEDNKPGEDFPKHTVFYLKWGDREATIRILPVVEYRRMYSVSKHYTNIFDEQLEGIRKASKDARFRLDNQMPFIPFYDATQEFQNKVKSFSFRNGKGFFFLTEYTIEPTIINNEQLTYFYQGISDDGRYYILGDFPVSAPFLPDDRYSDSHEGYVLPEYFYGTDSRRSNESRYEKYVSKIAVRLEKLPDYQFRPNLRKVRDVIASLKIED